MKSAVSVIIPARDEEGSIAAVLEEVPRDSVDRIGVVDNGASDRTGPVAAGLGAEVVREERRGYGSAVLAGLAALDDRTEIVIFLNADGSETRARSPA